MKKILIIAAAVLLFGSCKKDMISGTSTHDDLKKYAEMTSSALLLKANDGSGIQMSADKTNNGKRITRPFKSMGSGTISYFPGGGGGDCGDETVQFRSDGTGNSTALGLQTQVTTYCFNPENNQPLSEIGGVGTAANGDKLYYTLVGAGIDPVTERIEFQKYIFTGGTGRFTDATGNMTSFYSASTTSTYYEYTGECSITF